MLPMIGDELRGEEPPEIAVAEGTEVHQRIADASADDAVGTG